jgi:hypothetical protein
MCFEIAGAFLKVGTGSFWRNPMTPKKNRRLDLETYLVELGSLQGKSFSRRNVFTWSLMNQQVSIVGKHAGKHNFPPWTSCFEWLAPLQVETQLRPLEINDEELPAEKSTVATVRFDWPGCSDTLGRKRCIRFNEWKQTCCMIHKTKI